MTAAFDRAIALAEKDEAPARKPRESDTDYATRMVAEVTMDAKEEICA